MGSRSTALLLERRAVRLLLRLDPRADYALRRIGGFQALHQMDISRMPFVYRDFCEAYAQAPLAEQMAPRLQQQFGSPKSMANTIAEASQPAKLKQ